MHADPIELVVFLVAAPLAGVVASTLIGRLSDRRAIGRALLIGTSVAGVVGMGLTAFVRDYWFLLTLTVTAMALAGALFPQSFAYARRLLTRDGSSPAMGISTLRTVFSLAWAAGPPLAAVLLNAGGFAFVFGTAATMYAVAALGLCSALEVPLMLALGTLTTRIRVRALVLAGACCGVVYYALATALGLLILLITPRMRSSPIPSLTSPRG